MLRSRFEFSVFYNFWSTYSHSREVTSYCFWPISNYWRQSIWCASRQVMDAHFYATCHLMKLIHVELQTKTDTLTWENHKQINEERNGESHSNNVSSDTQSLSHSKQQAALYLHGMQANDHKYFPVRQLKILICIWENESPVRRIKWVSRRSNLFLPNFSDF